MRAGGGDLNSHCTVYLLGSIAGTIISRSTAHRTSRRFKTLGRRVRLQGTLWVMQMVFGGLGASVEISAKVASVETLLAKWTEKELEEVIPSPLTCLRVQDKT